MSKKSSFVYIGWFLISLLFANLFIYDFIFSQFDLLFLREVDDYAFQVSMHSIHKDLPRLYLRTVFSKVDYGYGNFFWLLHGLLTLPGYLLNWDAFVIIVPRIFSTFLFFASVILIYRMALQIGKDRLHATAVALLASSCPVLLYAAQRFHTHGMVTFLCLLSVYFCFKFSGERKLYLSTLALGLAAGTKMTALFLAPLLAFEWLSFYIQVPLTSAKVKIFLKQAGLFLFCFVFALSPTLFTFFIYKKSSQEILGNIQVYLANSRQSIGGSDDINPLLLFKNGFLVFYYPLTIWLSLVVGLVFSIFKCPREKKIFFAGLLLSSAAAGVYLLFRTGQGPWAISNYFLPLGLLLCLSVFYFPWKNRHTSLFIGGLIALQVFCQFDFIKKALRIYPDRKNHPSATQKMEIYNFLVPEFKKQTPHKVLRDYRLVLPIHPFQSPTQITEFFDNLPVIQESQPSFDWIAISKENGAFLPKDKIETFAAKDLLLEHQRLVEGLFEGALFGARYKKVYENKIGYVFAKDQ